MTHSIPIVVVLLVLGTLLLIPCIQGILTRQPFWFPPRALWVVLLALSPFTISLVDRYPYGQYNPLNLPGIILIVVILITWWRSSTYIVLGVTRESFETALHSVLSTLDHYAMPYSRTGSQFQLTSTGAVLTSFSFCMGAALTMDGALGYRPPAAHRQTLKFIAKALKEHFKSAPGKMNMVPVILCGALGILAIAFGAYIGVR